MKQSRSDQVKCVWWLKCDQMYRMFREWQRLYFNMYTWITQSPTFIFLLKLNQMGTLNVLDLFFKIKAGISKPVASELFPRDQHDTKVNETLIDPRIEGDWMAYFLPSPHPWLWCHLVCVFVLFVSLTLRYNLVQVQLSTICPGLFNSSKHDELKSVPLPAKTVAYTH